MDKLRTGIAPVLVLVEIILAFPSMSLNTNMIRSQRHRSCYLGSVQISSETEISKKTMHGRSITKELGPRIVA